MRAGIEEAAERAINEGLVYPISGFVWLTQGR
jgi:hypothetical protein